MLKAIAIDDEPIALEVVKSLSSKIAFIKLLNCFTNAFKAIDFLQQEKVDLIFLDIKMPDISGIDFLKSLSNPPIIIFTTAYSEHAVQSFELDAIDYLLKPFSLSRFLKACNKANEQFLLRNKTIVQSQELAAIFIKSGYQIIKVEPETILYAESFGNYVQFVLENRKITSRLTMSETEAFLPAPDFIRVHRSYIVSKKHIQKMNRKSIWIKQIELPIGAAYLSAIEKITK
ncbi:LytTR family DNA-binding domain-containing protein [Ferruginibacter sp.]|uniref:LytR/AlgR family response regulator transcription factor n=1 Tax=Ferruginibacter sp. TaxID=1940288 RepID=UPI00265A1D0C|nr:LytTR family DNA-binding domain-containing protein [Ferruginibacter sp.]